MALMYNMPRAATIQSAGDGMLWAMDRQTFRRIVLRNAFQKRKMYEALLEKVPLLSSLNVSSFSTYSLENISLQNVAFGTGLKIRSHNKRDQVFENFLIS